MLAVVPLFGLKPAKFVFVSLNTDAPLPPSVLSLNGAELPLKVTFTKSSDVVERVDHITSKSVPVCGIDVNSIDAAPPEPTVTVETKVIVMLTPRKVQTCYRQPKCQFVKYKQKK